MKYMAKILSVFAAGLFLFAACGTSPSTSGETPSSAAPASAPEPAVSDPAPSSGQTTEEIYRGTVESIAEDGSITVTQLPGYNYGQESIVFHLDDATVQDTSGGALAADAFVEVTYSGVLTRSLPPQGTAVSVTVIAPHSEGIIVNGTVQQVQDTDTGYSLLVLPFDAPADASEADSQVVLTVPRDALEHLTESDITEGVEVCAVTNGIAALSLPPQMPVVALLPYTA